MLQPKQALPTEGQRMVAVETMRLCAVEMGDPSATVEWYEGLFSDSPWSEFWPARPEVVFINTRVTNLLDLVEVVVHEMQHRHDYLCGAEMNEFGPNAVGCSVANDMRVALAKPRHVKQLP